MSTPLILPVLSIDGRTFADGGLTNNTPVDVARAMGAEVVIVSETGSPPLRPEEYRDVYGVGKQVVDALSRLRQTASAREGDIVIEPDLGRHKSEDYSRGDELIALGRVSAESSLPRLRGLPRLAGERAPAAESPRNVTAVEVTGASRVKQDAVRAAFGVETGDALDIDEVVRGLDRMWAMGLFETVWIDAWPAEDGVRLVVDVRETPHRYLELGGASDEQDQVAGFVRLRDRNLFGGGERLDLELLGGIDGRGIRTALAVAGTSRRPVGFHLRGQWLTQEPVVFVAGEDVGRARFVRTIGGGGVHLELGTDVLVQAGLMGGRVEAEPRRGVPVRSGTDAYRMLTGTVAWDRLDERDVSHSGFALVGCAERSLTGLGADRDYWRAWSTARAAVGLGGPFVLEAAAFGGLSERDVPAYDLFRLGGPRFLPGRPRDEFWNRQALAGWIAPSIDVGGFRASVYGGAGNAWGSRESISLSDLRHGIGLGVTRASRLGVIALDAGIDDDGHTAFYFSIGRRLP